MLSDKIRTTYVRTFELVKEKAVSLSLSLDPKIVLSDFEQAIKQAVDLCFLTAEFKGCYFHFSQALMRRFQAIGLQQAYSSDDEACRFLRRTADLAFVPVWFVRIAWHGVKASKPTHLQRIDEFVDYFETTWIAGSFTLQHWNVYENDTYCTNNHVEGWNS